MMNKTAMTRFVLTKKVYYKAQAIKLCVCFPFSLFLCLWTEGFSVQRIFFIVVALGFIFGIAYYLLKIIFMSNEDNTIYFLVDKDGIFIRNMRSADERRVVWKEIKELRMIPSNLLSGGSSLEIQLKDESLCFDFGYFYWKFRPNKLIKVLKNYERKKMKFICSVHFME